MAYRTGSFPRLYAAASLKRSSISYLMTLNPRTFSAALCRGLIEAASPGTDGLIGWCRFPRLYAAASLKRHVVVRGGRDADRFPRLYAAASLKPLLVAVAVVAAIGRFPRLYAAASLKLLGPGAHGVSSVIVFRGSMPRPH